MLTETLNDLVAPSATHPSDLVETSYKPPFKRIVPPPLRALGAETIRRLKAAFGDSHRPSPKMWEAISDIVRTLEDMADGEAEPKVHLTSLDPGIGKSQSVVHFLPVLLGSARHTGVGVIVCAGRKEQIAQMIEDAKHAGLNNQAFAVYTADDKLNALGRGKDDRQHAPILFTTHSMVMKRCKDARPFGLAEDFHYRGEPRQVRVWDEAITAGLAVTLSSYDLAALIKPVSFHSAKLSDRIGRLFALLLTTNDGEQFTIPDIAADCGLDLNDLEAMLDDAPDDLRTIANSFYFLCGKVVTVRHDGKSGKAILDYRETFPPDLKPLLVLDASSRRDVRETYSLWEEWRGDIKRLLEAPKDYSPATIHHWAVSGGKSAFRDRDKRKRLLQGVANEINQRPLEPWLVIHHLDKGKDEDFRAELRALLSPGADVAFLTWGAHDATNAFKDRSRVVLAGTLFLRPSHYEAIGRAAAGLPSSSGPFPKASFEAVRQGEHRHMILQAACRGTARKCDGSSCYPADIYIIASRASNIAEGLPVLFPGARVVPWQPVERKLTGKVGSAAAFILEHAKTGAFVADAEVMKHLRTPDKSNYNRTIKRHVDLRDALAEQGIEPCKQGRFTGFQHTAAKLFGSIEDNE